MSNLKFKFNIYKIREWADDIFFEIHNLLALTRFIYYYIRWLIIRKLLRQNEKIKNLYKNKKNFILTSVPSINNLDLNKIQDDIEKFAKFVEIVKQLILDKVPVFQRNTFISCAGNDLNLLLN